MTVKALSMLTVLNSLIIAHDNIKNAYQKQKTKEVKLMLKKKVAKTIAGVSKKMAVIACGSVLCLGTYQPVEPKAVKALKK